MLPPIPPNFKVGKAKGQGDCFFDSVAQCLKQIRPKNSYNVKTLRQRCAQFAKEQMRKDSWLTAALMIEKQNIFQYMKDVQYCVDDLMPGMKTPMWGRPEIEGRIICKIYDVKIHVIEKHVVENETIWIDVVVDKNGSKSINQFTYETNNSITVINKGAEHFEPVLAEMSSLSTQNKHAAKHNEKPKLKPYYVGKFPNDHTEYLRTRARSLQIDQTNNCNALEMNIAASVNTFTNDSHRNSVHIDYNAKNQIHIIKENELFQPILKECVGESTANAWDENAVSKDFIALELPDSSLVDTSRNDIDINLTVKDSVEKYWKDKKMLNDKENLLIDVLNPIQLNKLDIEKFGIQFKDGKIKEWAELLEEHKVLHVVAGKDAKYLSIMCAIQVVNSNDEWGFEKGNSLYIELSQLMKTNKHILKAYGSKKALVIDVTGTNELDTALQQMSSLIKRNKDINVILISENEMEIISGKYFPIHRVFDRKVFRDLQEESQKLVSQKNVIFQGTSIQLCSLVDFNDSNAQDVISSGTVMKILNDEDIAIGKKPQRLIDLEAAIAKLNTAISPNNLVAAFKNLHEKSLFLMFGVTDDELLKLDGDLNSVIEELIQNKTIQTFRLQNNDNMLLKFQQICENELIRVVYLIAVTSGEYILQQVYDPNFYMKRKLYHPKETKISFEILFQENISDTVILESEFGKQGILKILEMYALKHKLELDMQCFEDNCESLSILFETANNKEQNILETGNPIHWFRVESQDAEHLIWLHSIGSLEGIAKYITSCLDEESFGKHVQDKCVIIADDPGMGKSTTLTSLTGQMLDTNWVIRVDFRECKESINALAYANEKQLTFEDIVDFFSKIENTGLQSEQSKNLLLYKMQQTMPQNRDIMVLFDAYDELGDKMQENVIPLLKFLKEKTSAKVWVTTRLTRVKELEKDLETFATRFEVMDKIHQQEFLHNYWIVRLNLSVESDGLSRKLTIYATDLLKRCEEILGEEISHFMGIPLQLRLLAEGFKNDVLQYCQTENESLNFIKLNLINMYQQFIDERYNTYFTEKVNCEGLPEVARNILKHTYNQHHRYLALNELFPYENNLCNDYNPPADEEESALKSVGMIQSFGSDGNTYFIHRTFAEYFAADFLASNLDKPSSRQTTIQFLMRQIFPLKSNIAIRDFLDKMLSVNSKIHMAVLEGNLSKLLESVNSTTIEKFVDNLGRTALHLAARDGHETIAKVLLDNGYDAFKQDDFGKTCLHHATMNGYDNIVHHLLHYTSDIDIKSAFLIEIHPNRNCIFMNPDHLSSNIVKFVNERDLNGASSLSVALTKQYWKIASILITFGADVRCLRERKRDAILDWNKNNNNVFTEAIRFLERNYEDIQELLWRAVVRNDLGEVKRLVSNGADVNIKDKSGRTPLDWTFLNLDFKNQEAVNIVKYLLLDCKVKHEFTVQEYLIASKIIVTGDHTLLHEAATLHRRFFAAYLIHLGADVNMRDQEGRTPLHHAALSYLKRPFRKTNIVKCLLENGAKHDAKDIYNNTVLDYIRNTHSLDLKLISDLDNVLRDPHTAISLDSDLRLITKYYCTVNGHSLMQVAITKKDRELLSHLITHVYRYQINEKDKQGNTLLHRAASIGWAEGVTYLLKCGAHFNPINCDGETPKQIAEKTITNKEIIETLQTIQHVFDVIKSNNTDWVITTLNSIKSKKSDLFLVVINSKNNEGITPLHLAAKSNNFQIVHFLLTVGAGYDARNKNRQTFPELTYNQEIKHLFNLVNNLFTKGTIDYKPTNERMSPCYFVNARNKYRQTFLHCVNFNCPSFYYTINYFIKNGADINAIDIEDRTVLNSAIVEGIEGLDFVQFLLKKGFNFSNLSDDKLEKLKDEAKSSGREDILAMLQ